MEIGRMILISELAHINPVKQTMLPKGYMCMLSEKPIYQCKIGGQRSTL